MPISATTDWMDKAEVVCDPAILGGMPVIRGTRIPAETLRQYLIAGDDGDEMYADYPWLPIGAPAAVKDWCRRSGLPCTAS